MRDYQRKKSNPYILPKNLYKQTLYQIRDYNRMKEDYEDMMYESPAPPDGQPKGNGTGDPTGTLAVRLSRLSARINAIDKAKKEIPSEYLNGVWQNIIYEKPYPNDASRNTYGIYKSRFIYYVAKYLTLL